MEKVEYLPLGSVIVVRGSVKKAMIIARGLTAEIDSRIRVFDYGGCLYPEGLLGDRILYFNHGDIARVVFEGFNDEDNEMIVENINSWMMETPYERGNVAEISKSEQTSAEKDVL